MEEIRGLRFRARADPMAQRSGSTAELAKRLAKERRVAGHDEPFATTRMPAYLSDAHNKAWERRSSSSGSARKSKHSVDDKSTCSTPSIRVVSTLFAMSARAKAEDAPPPELWTMQPTANASFTVPTRSPERLPSCEASIRRADIQARDASIQHIYDLAQRTLQDPWTRRAAPETRTLLTRHREHLVKSAVDIPEAPVVVPLAPELLSRAREMGIEAPGPSTPPTPGGF